LWQLQKKAKKPLKKISTNHHVIALIDLCHTDMEGTELFQLIHDTSPSTVKIMLTGKTLLQDSIEGVDALLRKPIQPDQLFSVIDNKLKNKNIKP